MQMVSEYTEIYITRKEKNQEDEKDKLLTKEILETFRTFRKMTMITLPTIWVMWLFLLINNIFCCTSLNIDILLVI